MTRKILKKIKLTTVEQLTESVANFIGSWKFIIIQTTIFVIWVIVNSIWWLHAIVWDPYPFILFNLFMSAEAAYSSPLILMSQNRLAAWDRSQAEQSYRANAEAKREIEALQRAITRIENEKLDHIRDLTIEIHKHLDRVDRHSGGSRHPPES